MYSFISLRSYFNNSPQVSNILCKIPWENTHTHIDVLFWKLLIVVIVFISLSLKKEKKPKKAENKTIPIVELFSCCVNSGYEVKQVLWQVNWPESASKAKRQRKEKPGGGKKKVFIVCLSQKTNSAQWNGFLEKWRKQQEQQ